MKNKIQVVVATYNGDKFLDEQLKSITNNTKSVEIIVVDDRSEDNSLNIIKKHKESANIRNVSIRDVDNLNYGPSANFSRGLALTTANYIMLCDQDDFWHNDKVEKSYLKLCELEQEHGKNTPLLVFTDLCVVDENLKLISTSFFNFQGSSASWANSFSHLMTQNVAPGCTMIFNRALLNLAQPIHKDALMHDWWLILVASAFGQVSYLNEATIKYRQHTNNQVGAKKFSFFKLLKNFKQAKENFYNTVLQAKAFLIVYDEKLKKSLNKNDYVKLCHFAALLDVKYLTRIKYFINGDFPKNNIVRNLGVFLILLTTYKYHENH